MVNGNLNPSQCEAGFFDYNENMDTISLIIITAFATTIINGIVSNFIFLRYQKKIEESFVKSKLEFETKFIRNHEKLVQTLETIYQKYSEFRLEATRCLLDIISSLRGDEIFHKEVNLSDIRKRLTEAFEISDKLFDYHIQHSLYLPTDISSEVGQILSRTKLIAALIEMGIRQIENPDFIEFESLELMMGIWQIEPNFDINKPSMEAFFEGIVTTLRDYSSSIEKHYREMAKDV